MSCGDYTKHVNSYSTQLDKLNDLELVDEYQKVLKDMKNLRDKKQRIEFKADTLMRDRGSQVIQGDTKELKRNSRTAYDKTKLTPLKEHIPMEDLIRRKAIIPKHTETIDHEEKWGSMTSVKALSEYGNEIQGIIANSVIEKTINYTLRDRR
tara:strand:- start:2994 stop:3449 length:456 start_codon:yes stop_codon:yes gene_type:complete